MKAFFLDRDGVINEGYNVNKPKDFIMIKGVPEAIRHVNELGYEVFVVTNQGGVGLGYITEQDLEAINEHLCNLIEEAGGSIREIKSCTHKPHTGCECRKPKPGMIVELIDRYKIDREHSYMVGDRDVDIQAGQSAGVSTIFIGRKEPAGVKPDYIFSSLYEAVSQLHNAGENEVE